MGDLTPAAKRYLSRCAHGNDCGAEEHTGCGYLGVEGVPVWRCDFSMDEASCKADRVCACGLDDLRRAVPRG